MSSEAVSNNNGNGMSALEKAKLLKAEREQAKQAEAAKSKAEKEARQRELDEKYLVDKNTLSKLKEDKTNIDQDISNIREERKQNILGQRAAIKEMLGDNTSDEDREFFKENKKDIFGDDENKLTDIKSDEKELKSKAGEMEKDISEREESLKESFSETKEDKEKFKKEVEEQGREKSVEPENKSEVSEIKSLKSAKDHISELYDRHEEIMKEQEGYAKIIGELFNNKSLLIEFARVINKYRDDFSEAYLTELKNKLQSPENMCDMALNNHNKPSYEHSFKFFLQNHPREEFLFEKMVSLEKEDRKNEYYFNSFIEVENLSKDKEKRDKYFEYSKINDENPGLILSNAYHRFFVGRKMVEVGVMTQEEFKNKAETAFNYAVNNDPYLIASQKYPKQ